MPDRYGDPEDRDPVHDENRELYAIAMTVPCTYCNAQPGKPCINKTLPNSPPTRIPHTARTNDAIEVPF